MTSAAEQHSGRAATPQQGECGTEQYWPGRARYALQLPASPALAHLAPAHGQLSRRRVGEVLAHGQVGQRHLAWRAVGAGVHDLRPGIREQEHDFAQGSEPAE